MPRPKIPTHPARYLDLPDDRRLWRWQERTRAGLLRVSYWLEGEEVWSAEASDGPGALANPDALALADAPQEIRVAASSLDWEEGTLTLDPEGWRGDARAAGRPPQLAGTQRDQTLRVPVSPAERARIEERAAREAPGRPLAEWIRGRLL